MDAEIPLSPELGTTVNQPGDEYLYFELHDPEGHVYSECLMYGKGLELPESVDPGATIQGYITFAVPVDWSTLTLTAKYRVVPNYDEQSTIFQQEISKSDLSTPP